VNPEKAMLEGFDPVVSNASRVLVLGTVPGAASLEAGEYYAHPRNSFWDIMEALFGVRRDTPYAERTAQLADGGVALWDVLAAAERSGSLDSDILPGSMTTNYFPGFLAAYPRIRTVFFNGEKAEDLFMQLVSPGVARAGIHLSMRRLPSTSPANTMSLEAKTAAWSCVADALRGT
jgi:TDG/mug DNA glycosylase family protein